MLFFCFLPAVTTSETSLHHWVLDIVTYWNKGELDLFHPYVFIFLLSFLLKSEMIS